MTTTTLLISLKNQSLVQWIESDPLTLNAPNIYNRLKITTADSLDRGVTINTDGLLTFTNCIFDCAGEFFYSNGYGAKVKAINCLFIGRKPTISGRTRGQILLEDFKHFELQNCYLVNVGGVKLQTYVGNGVDETIKITKNKVLNIDGRDWLDQALGAGYQRQFVQLNEVIDVPGVELGWNHIENKFKQSLVEDVFNIGQSSGTDASPIRIHNNLIDGAYPLNETVTNFAGSAIMCDRAHATNPTHNVLIEDNHVIRTVNCGIGIAGGNRNTIQNNVIISRCVGITGEGTEEETEYNLYGQGNNGIARYNDLNAPPEIYYDNTVVGNTAGFVNRTSTPVRQDIYGGGNSDGISGNIKIAPENDVSVITKPLEDAQIVAFYAKVTTEGLIIGKY
jgi:hypothetical protein